MAVGGGVVGVGGGGSSECFTGKEWGDRRTGWTRVGGGGGAGRIVKGTVVLLAVVIAGVLILVRTGLLRHCVAAGVAGQEARPQRASASCSVNQDGAWSDSSKNCLLNAWRRARRTSFSDCSIARGWHSRARMSNEREQKCCARLKREWRSYWVSSVAGRES